MYSDADPLGEEDLTIASITKGTGGKAGHVKVTFTGATLTAADYQVADNGYVQNQASFTNGRTRGMTKAKVEHVYLRADTIKVINYNISGRIKTEGKMFGEIREGKWTSYYPSGKKWSLNNFKGGEKHGEYKTWHPNEQLNISGFYSMGASTGEWMFYDSTGVLTKQYDVTPQH